MKNIVILTLLTALILGAIDIQACVTLSKPIKRAERLYERRFTNSCNYSITFKYKYWNGKKWISVIYNLEPGESMLLPAGIDGRIKDFEE